MRFFTGSFQETNDRCLICRLLQALYVANSSGKEVKRMKFEMPVMTVLHSEEKNTAMSPECCSVKWSGCCYKE